MGSFTETYNDPQGLVCYTAVFSVVTQRSHGGALRDDTKNGCVADYQRACSAKMVGTFC